MTNLIQLRIFLHLKEMIIIRPVKNKALHRILYSITADKVNENKVSTGLTYKKIKLKLCALLMMLSQLKKINNLKKSYW